MPSSGEQQDKFGDRISWAVQEAFSAGFEHLIVVGSDVPRLSSSDILAAKEALEAGRSVIGRDYRGGVYLFGISLSSFRQNQFCQLPWQTAALADKLHAYFGQNDTLELVKRRDINALQDLHALSFLLAGFRAWSFLNNTDHNFIGNPSTLATSIGFGESRTNRGPPLQ